MPTHAEISSKLLSEAASFFVNLGEQNAEIKEQMTENARVFTQMSELLEEKPNGQIDDKTHGELAGRLLADAAGFFLSLADQNEPIKEQMEQNAHVYKQMAELVSTDPLGIME